MNEFECGSVCCVMGVVLVCFDCLIMILVVILGFVMDGMICGEGWCFFDMGCCFECVFNLIMLVCEILFSVIDCDGLLFEVLFEVVDSGIIYC